MNDTTGVGHADLTSEGYLERGEEAGSRGSWNEARAYFEKARELDPLSWKALQGLGVAEFWSGRRDEAWDLLLEALRRAPEEPDNATNLLDVARSLGREDEAERILAGLSSPSTTIIHHAGSPAEAVCVRGEELVAAELWKEAQQTFLEAIDRDPSRSRAWSGLGISCFRTGLRTAGTAFFEMAMRLEPDDEDAVLNWAESCGRDAQGATQVLCEAGVPEALRNKALQVLG
jgi:tetratricopeptide (TPR) repeat protein